MKYAAGKQVAQAVGTRRVNKRRSIFRTERPVIVTRSARLLLSTPTALSVTENTIRIELGCLLSQLDPTGIIQIKQRKSIAWFEVLKIDITCANALLSRTPYADTMNTPS